jgi:membrane protein YdbS with pleckstrin-like domain
MLKSKFFWLNLIALAILIVQYFVTNQMFTQWLAWEGLAIVVLNAIAGMIQTQQVVELKAQNAKLTAQLKNN